MIGSTGPHPHDRPTMAGKNSPDQVAASFAKRNQIDRSTPSGFIRQAEPRRISFAEAKTRKGECCRGQFASCRARTGNATPKRNMSEGRLPSNAEARRG